MWHECDRAVLAVCEDLVRDLVDEEVETCNVELACLTFANPRLSCRTYDETFHLVFPNHLYTQRLRDPVVVLERTAARRHDAQLF